MDSYRAEQYVGSLLGRPFFPLFRPPYHSLAYPVVISALSYTIAYISESYVCLA